MPPSAIGIDISRAAPAEAARVEWHDGDTVLRLHNASHRADWPESASSMAASA